MTYKIVRLAPGSYDLVLEGEVVASLVRSSTAESGSWFVELLDDKGPRPSPFSNSVHEFESFADATQWLGNPEQVAHTS